MNNLVIEKLSIVDYENKRANIFEFSECANLIVSKTNGQGKSSLIKSIYFSLGCNVKAFPSGWEPEKYIFQIDVIINNQRHRIKRHNKIISVQNKKESIIFKNIREYSEWLQNKLSMSLKLTSKNGNQKNYAYVDALLSLFYIDQDKGWGGVLYRETFEGLGQYDSSIFPKDVVDYFLGISNTELNDKISRQSSLKNERDSIKVRIEQVEAVYETYLEKKETVIVLPRGIDELKLEIQDYISEVNDISNEIQKVTSNIEKEKLTLDIHRQDKKELELLLSYTSKRFNKIKYKCSYCHSILTREQSLTRLELEDNRLAINSRKEEIVTKINSSENLLEEYQCKMDSLKEKIDIFHSRLKEIKSITDIENYISQSVLVELKSLKIQERCNKEKLDKEIERLSEGIKISKRNLEKRATDIKCSYEYLKNELSTLIGSNGLVDKPFRQYKKLKGSGTNLNKDLLTIYLVYMNLIANRTKFSFPFAIDSFVKNETDKQTLEGMFNAINNKFLTLNGQTFFSIIEENLKYINKEYRKIEIESPLLKKEKYKEVSESIIEFGD